MTIGATENITNRSLQIKGKRSVYVRVTRRPIDASIQRVYLLGFKELSFNILETRK